MQRLFSTFPNGWPGLGLVLLRVVAGVVLLVDTVPALGFAPSPYSIAWQGVAIGVSLMLVVGFWVPLAGVAMAVIEGWYAVGGPAFESFHLLGAVVGAGLAMLGPGHWSLDARLYGRKRIDAGR